MNKALSPVPGTTGSCDNWGLLRSFYYIASQGGVTRAAKAQGKKPKSSSRQSVGEAFMKSIARSLGSAAGRQLFRGVLGSLLK